MKKILAKNCIPGNKYIWASENSDGSVFLCVFLCETMKEILRNSKIAKRKKILSEIGFVFIENNTIAIFREHDEMVQTEN